MKKTKFVVTPLRHLHKPAGFTLLELLVVMVIIGLLAGYVGPKYFSQIGKSEVKVTRAQIDGLGKALDHFRLDIGRYPSTEEGLAVLKFGAPGDPRPLAMMESRAWYEWHWARGKDPGSSRRLDPILRASVIERDGLVCGICFGEVEANDVHIDHIYPVALGGKDVMDNLRVTHSLCNMRKGAKIDGP